MRIAPPSIRRSPGLIRSATSRSSFPSSCRNLLTLAIETSCDDTAVAIVEKTDGKARLRFNERITASQGQLRGIHPILSLESHEARLAGLVQKSFLLLPDTTSEEHQNGRSIRVIVGDVHVSKSLPDLVSVTRGPGMRSSLSAGLNVAKGLAAAWQLPLIGVHHMQAHALTPRLMSAMENAHAADNSSIITPVFPYLSLLVSGGHTMLIRSESLTSHRILTNTADYAIGDCLDKISRAILPRAMIEKSPSPSYGPLLEAFAFPKGAQDYAYHPPRNSKQENREANAPGPYGWHMPTPFSKSRGGSKSETAEFSLTGIESQARRIAEYGWDKEHDKLRTTPRSEPMAHAEAQYLAHEAMRVAFQHLASRVLQVLIQERHEGTILSRDLVLSGGVASNQYLRHVMKLYLSARGFDINILAPPVDLCTDNAAMIGWTACEMWEAGYTNGLDIRALGKWSLENLMHPELETDGRSWLDNHADKSSTL